MSGIPTTLAELVKMVDGIRFDHNPTAIIVTPAEFAALKRVSVPPPQRGFTHLPPFVVRTPIVGTPIIVDYGDHVLRSGEVRLRDYLEATREGGPPPLPEDESRTPDV